MPDAAPPKLDTAPALVPDASPPKLDTAPVSVPDASPPKLDTGLSPPDSRTPDLVQDLATATGGTGGTDAGADGTGGTAGSDASIDQPPAGGTDGGGSDGRAGSDVSIDQPSSPGREAGVDATGEAGNANDGGVACSTPKAAWGYDDVLSSFTNLAWDKDGSLIAAATFYPLVKPPMFGSKTVTSYGGADILVSKIDPSTGNASWVVTVGDELDQNVTSAAVSDAGPGVIGTFLGTVDVFNGNQPDKVIVNSATTPVDFIAGFNDADGSGLWAKKVNLGDGGLNAIAGQPGKDFFVVCGAATNNAASLAVTGTTTPPGTPGGGRDVVVAAIKDGNVLWSHLFGGAGDQMCTSAALDDDGNAIFAGSYAGVLDFGTGALSPAPTDTPHAILWVAKFNGVTGATMAAKAFGTTGQVQTNSAGVTADAQGNVIVGGIFYGPMIFGSTTLTPLGADTFVAKLDASLVPIWARRWGGSSGVACAMGVAADSNRNVTVVGNFHGTIDVGPGSTVLTSTGNSPPTNLNPFVVSLDGAAGQTLCAQAYGDASLVGGNAAAVAVNRQATGANQDATAIVGYFTPYIDFGGPTTPLVSPAAISSTGDRGFLLRM